MRALAVVVLAIPLIASSADAGGTKVKARAQKIKKVKSSSTKAGSSVGLSSKSARRDSKLSRIMSRRSDGATSVAMRGQGTNTAIRPHQKSGLHVSLDSGGLVVRQVQTTERVGSRSERQAKPSRGLASRSAVRKANNMAIDMRHWITRGATPAMGIVASNSGVKLKLARKATRDPRNSGSGTPPLYRIEKKLPNDTLDVIALLPISGYHTNASGTSWTKNNPSPIQMAQSTDFKIRVIHPDGRQDTVTVGAGGLVTQAGVKVKLKPGVTKLQFWPAQSAGVGAEPAMRQVEFDYGG